MIEVNSLSELDTVCNLARKAHAQPWRNTLANQERLANLLDGIADRLLEHKLEIVEIAMQETHLPAARLNGECDRTASQFRNHAIDARTGRWAKVDEMEALPERVPPRPHIRRFHMPLGPIAVFGASNFPLAYSVAGGDTASALAAGCPVVVKAHPAHPETSRLVASLLSAVVAEQAFHEGFFQCIAGGNDISVGLVEHPAIAGVGFTGSEKVGRLFMDAAARRPVPIPVFAEMGSINPIFVFGSGLKGFAEGYVQSLTLGVGQFCTNPGVVLGVVTDDWAADWEAEKAKIVDLVRAASVGKMLTPGIESAYVQNAQHLCAQPGVKALVPVEAPGQPGLAEVSGDDFSAQADLREEVFGPFGLLVTCKGAKQALEIAEQFGSLTASIFADVSHSGEGKPIDSMWVGPLTSILTRKVGRVVFNGFPTGVDVGEATQHGGPYPASSDSRFTSVGNHAVERWLRPVAYQNAPDWI